MSILRSYLNSAAVILKTYTGTEPFHLYIKKYFTANKKFGSKDRKQISSLCYNFFRLGKALKNISAEERILLGTFLCGDNNELLQNLKPEWNDHLQKPLIEKLDFLNKQFEEEKIFPFADELSGEVDAEKFNISFLSQPKLFLRVRPGNTKKVTGKLSGAGIQYQLSGNCITLSAGSKIDSVIELDKEAVVQDYNSQRVGEFLLSVRREPSDREAVVQDYNSQRVGEFLLSVRREPSDRVWDCCAASGGKSIMAFDINPKIELSVSDKRESILENLKKRFAKAGINKYNSFVADLSTQQNVQASEKFGVQTRYDLIICDVPCTGSGTWARTPEQLYYFKHQQIEKYAALQKQIVKNVIPYLKEGGKLLYITCSVFKKENEDAVNFIKENFNFSIDKQQLLKGYEMQADTMFAALLTAPAV